MKTTVNDDEDYWIYSRKITVVDGTGQINTLDATYGRWNGKFSP